jgi:hypothetical protein
VGALEARRRELRSEQVVRAQGDEPVRLDPPAPLEDLLDRRLEVVEADLREHAAEPLKRLDVQLKERLLGLDQRRLAERRPRERGAHHEQVHGRRDAREHDLGLAPVDLRLDPGRVDLRHEHLPDRPAQQALALTHVVPDRRLPDIGTMLVDEPLPDPLGGVALLARRLPIGLQPRVDQRPERAELGRRPAHRRSPQRRQRRLQRRAHRAAMHPMALRQRPQRQPLPNAVTPDLFELLHSGSHPSVPPISARN